MVESSEINETDVLPPVSEAQQAKIRELFIDSDIPLEVKKLVVEDGWREHTLQLAVDTLEEKLTNPEDEAIPDIHSIATLAETAGRLGMIKETIRTRTQEAGGIPGYGSFVERINPVIDAIAGGANSSYTDAFQAINTFGVQFLPPEQ